VHDEGPSGPSGPGDAATPAWDDVVWSATVAGVLSGGPSTVHAVATSRSPLAAARAAGELLGGAGLVRGALAHSALSLGWAAVLSRALPPGPRTA